MFLYPLTVTAQLSRLLDSRHGNKGWVTRWCAADAQTGEQIALCRTLYVGFLSPRFQAWTPWRNLHFTHKTTTPHKPWHYVVCVIGANYETTYYWSMRKHRWIVAWENDTHQYPVEEQAALAKGLRTIQRRRGLNWTEEPDS